MRSFNWLKSLFFCRKKYHCHIVEVSTTAQEVVFAVGKSAFLRCKLTEAVADLGVLDRLPSCEACWLGGYYGRALRAALEGREALKKAKNMTFLLSNKQGRYQIIYQNRDGEIGYVDKKTRREFREQPLTIVNNRAVIADFDPRQACYIGILAGTSLERILASGKNLEMVERIIDKPPQLRIVE